MRIFHLLLVVSISTILTHTTFAADQVRYKSGKSATSVQPGISSPAQINAVPHPISASKPQRKYHKDPMPRPQAKQPVEMYDPTNPRFILDKAADMNSRDVTDYEACKSFQGIPNTGWDPPDPHMAAGPNHIVEVVNSSIAIYDKNTGALLMQATAGFWFQNTVPPPASGFIFDPKVVYDPVGGHFIILFLCTDDVSESSYLVSVSQTADAMGSWWSYNFDATVDGTTPANCWPDYPGLGFDYDEAVYLTSNQWIFNGGYAYSKIRILPKQQLYTGGAVSFNDLWDLRYNDNSTAFTVKPAVTYSDANGEFLLSNLWYGSNHTTYWKINSPLLNPTVTLKPQVNIPGYPSTPSAAQKSGADIGTMGSMTQEVVFRNGKVYTSFDQGFNWGSGTVAAIRVLGIDTTTSTATVDHIFGANGKHYYFPGIYVDPADRIFLVFNRSAVDEFVGVWYSEDLAATNSSRLLKAGEGARGGGAPVRWGDYAAIAGDPVDQNKVWVCNEYNAVSSGTWRTWIGQIPSAVSKPALSQPDDNSMKRSPVMFAWDALNPANSYQFQLDDDSNFTSIDQFLIVDSNTVSVSGLTDQVKYYWRVAGISNCPNNVWSTKRSFTACAYLTGDADGTGIVTISDAVFLVVYIFSGGAAPVPYFSGDVDCDATLTISDAVYLINYIFSGGPAPCDPCS